MTSNETMDVPDHFRRTISTARELLRNGNALRSIGQDKEARDLYGVGSEMLEEFQTIISGTKCEHIYEQVLNHYICELSASEAAPVA